MLNNSEIEMLDRVSSEQQEKSESREFLPCPKCGMNELRTPLVLNSTSKVCNHKQIYICSDCASEEVGSKIFDFMPVSDWWRVKYFRMLDAGLLDEDSKQEQK